jgi:hypothetical protein
MSAKDADEWSKDSTISGALYHGTESSNEAGIKADGFRMNEDIDQNTFGPGAYFARSNQYASIYGPEPLEIRVNVRNTKVYDSRFSFAQDATKFSMNYSEINNVSYNEGLKVYHATVRKAHDSILVKGASSSNGTVVVFNKKNITVVE